MGKRKLKKQINFMKNNNFVFSYTDYKTFGEKKRKINNPLKFDYSSFLRNTSIATSTMMIKRKVLETSNLLKLKFVKIFF